MAPSRQLSDYRLQNISVFDVPKTYGHHDATGTRGSRHIVRFAWSYYSGRAQVLYKAPRSLGQLELSLSSHDTTRPSPNITTAPASARACVHKYRRTMSGKVETSWIAKKTILRPWNRTFALTFVQNPRSTLLSFNRQSNGCSTSAITELQSAIVGTDQDESRDLMERKLSSSATSRETLERWRKLKRNERRTITYISELWINRAVLCFTPESGHTIADMNVLCLELKVQVRNTLCDLRKIWSSENSVLIVIKFNFQGATEPVFCPCRRSIDTVSVEYKGSGGRCDFT
ncbi:hypothetical protein C8J56DRAFT_898738 [Mycena floridula]|nr:hypothetical protein C8J56DRAFT_898738 [Mycena floridula]